ncbi:MAG: HPr family phosphocarrier protein [Oscillospiraceae bacterium]|nr:HPr family phosphocarrier protein [Oscillospiraceae bacterium]
MITRKTTVINKTGLHARPASDFVLKAKSFESKVTIREANGSEEPVNAKSIIRLLAIGVAQGTEIEIAADGPDEQAAVDALVALVASGFGEE